MSDKIYIVGIVDDGVEGLIELVCEIFVKVEVVIGFFKIFCLIGLYIVELIVIGGDLMEVIDVIECSVNKCVVMLMFGDLFFYGIV